MQSREQALCCANSTQTRVKSESIKKQPKLNPKQTKDSRTARSAYSWKTRLIITGNGGFAIPMASFPCIEQEERYPTYRDTSHKTKRGRRNSTVYFNTPGGTQFMMGQDANPAEPALCNGSPHNTHSSERHRRLMLNQITKRESGLWQQRCHAR